MASCKKQASPMAAYRHTRCIWLFYPACVDCLQEVNVPVVAGAQEHVCCFSLLMLCYSLLMYTPDICESTQRLLSTRFLKGGNKNNTMSRKLNFAYRSNTLCTTCKWQIIRFYIWDVRISHKLKPEEITIVIVLVLLLIILIFLNISNIITENYLPNVSKLILYTKK